MVFFLLQNLPEDAVCRLIFLLARHLNYLLVESDGSGLVLDVLRNHLLQGFADEDGRGFGCGNAAQIKQPFGDSLGVLDFSDGD